MNIEHLNTFLDLVETRNFNRTADRLNVNQSTVSFRIRALEKALGAQLFVRGRAELTPEGEKFESYALNLRLGWNLACQEVGMPSGYTGRIRVAMQIQLADRLTSDWGLALRDHLPNTTVHIGTDYSRAMTDQLVFGNLDLAVIYDPEHRPELYVEHAFDEAFAMVATYPARLDEITRDEYVLIIESSYFQARHAEALPHLHQPTLGVQIGSMALACLRARGGAAYLPSRVANQLVDQGELFPVTGAPVLHQPVHIVCHSRNRHQSSVIAAIDLLRTIDINRPTDPGAPRAIQ